MKKKIISMVVMGSLIFAGAFMTLADSNIVNSMDFQGEAIELSLDDAIEQAQTESLSAQKAEWNKKVATEVAWDYAGTASQVEDYGKKTDAKKANITSDYIDEQRNKNYTAELNAIRSQVIQQYFSIINLNDMVQINEQNLEVRTTLYDNVVTKFELGMVAKQDVLKAEYEMMKSQTTLEESKSNLKKAKMGFNLFLGYDTMQEVVLTDKISESAEVEDMDIATAVSKALAERNEIYAAKFKLDLQQVEFKRTQTRYPSGSTTYIKQKVATEEAAVQYELSFGNVEMDVRAKYLDMNQKKEAVETNKKSVEAMKEALRLVRLSYDAGLAVLTDVQETQSMYHQAQLGLSNAILDYNIAVDAFNESTGVGGTAIPLEMEE